MVLGSALAGLCVAAVTLLVAAAIATIVLFLGWDWSPYLHTVGLSIAFTGVALGGIFAGARAGVRGWLVGGLTGALFVLICYVLCVLTGVKEIIAALTLIRALAACLTGAVGGILGVNFSS